MSERPSFAPTARAQAQVLLSLVLRDRLTLDEALVKAPPDGTEADQRYARLLARTVLQRLGQIDTLIGKYLESPLPAKRHAVMNALRLGVAQLLCLGTPAHAAVNESVAMVKRGPDAALSGLVNAILQRIVREVPTLPPPVENVPQWLRARWVKNYGAETVAQIAKVAVARPPLDLTVRGESYPLGQKLDAHHYRLPPEHEAVESLPGYDEGAFFVQDIAASYPVRMLGDVRGLRVLDVCAAPGGKAAQLCWAGAEVVAIDRSNARTTRLRENMARLKCNVEVMVADALQWTPEGRVDAILLDAPCTATGTWRRHPEVVQLTAMTDIAEMVRMQRELLARAWEWLTPGGKMVYCVCSLEPEEGEAQAEWFLSSHSDAAALPIDVASGIPPEAIRGNYLRTTPALMPESGGMDGFFAVCFEKR